MTRALAVAFALAVAIPAEGQELWGRLGMSEETAQQHLWNGLADGSFNAPALPALRALPPGARSSLITQLASYAKTWSRSAAFKARYADYREERKPAGAGDGDKSMAERKKADRAAIRNSIAEIEKNAKLVPADQQGMFQELLQTQRDQLKAIDDPNNPMYSKEADAGMQALNAAQAAEQSAALKEWETKYPPSPTAMIRESLRAFLAMSATVDFSATLVKGSSGKMMFTNAEYESRPGEWKALYRAGRETTTALRAAAQQWLGELK